MIIKKILTEAASWRTRVSKLINYITTAQTDSGIEKCIHTEGVNFFCTDKERMKAEVLGLAYASAFEKKTPKEAIDPLEHWVISWNDLEMPKIDQISHAAKIFLKEMGFENHQTVMGIHGNTENLHIHLMISRIDPFSLTLKSSWMNFDQAMKANAKITTMLGCSPLRNNKYVWHIDKGIYRNKYYKQNLSVFFKFISPKPVIVEMPVYFQEPEFSEMTKKYDCWFYPNVLDPAIIQNGNKLYFLNWMYKDTIENIKKLRNEGCRLICSTDTAHVFYEKKEKKSEYNEYIRSVFQDSNQNVFDASDETYIAGENIYVRKKNPEIPIVINEKPNKINAWEFYTTVKKFMKNVKKIPEVRLSTISAIYMRAYSWSRADINECLLRDGLNLNYADHLIRWLYSYEGRKEIFRLQKQKLIKTTEISYWKEFVALKMKNKPNQKLRLLRRKSIMERQREIPVLPYSMRIRKISQGKEPIETGVQQENNQKPVQPKAGRPGRRMRGRG